MGGETERAFDVEKHVPESVSRLFEVFKANEFELYAVGGCIRNLLLQREPKDWDFATSATTDELIHLCQKEGLSYIPTGIEYGTLTLIIEGNAFEVTTFRIEGRYSGRAPAELQFSRSLHEDLKRRDFTMNAIAWNPQMGLIDLFGGMKDIENKVIRIIGDGQRFEEDPLRLLRAARFAAQLNFAIDETTFTALSDHGNALQTISKERITDEMNKLLLSDNVTQGMTVLNASGLLHYVLPEVEAVTQFNQKNPHHDKDLFSHLVWTVQNTAPELCVRWAALLHDIGKPECMTVDELGCAHYYEHSGLSAEIAEKILSRFSLSKTDQKRILLLIAEHMTLDEIIGKKGIKRLLSVLDSEGLEALMDLTLADKFLARLTPSFSDAHQFKKRIELLIKSIQLASEPYQMSQLAITGADIMALGFTAGPRIGQIKAACLSYVMEHPEMNERELLVKWVQSNYSID